MHDGADDALRAARVKERRLVDWLVEQRSVLVGFSGGVDSAYLACVAVEALGAARVLAVIGRSASYPAEQWATARAAAERVGLPVLEVDTDELSDPRYAANPTNRCYFCKGELWSRLRPIAEARGFAAVVDGTNADDRRDYRPGAQAAREHGVRSPLADAGLTKAEIRLLSRERGIPTWSQPSSPCLSSRLPYGLPVTPERLRQVERAEQALRELGASGDLRVRHHGDLARVELARDTVPAWLSAERLRSVRIAVGGAGFARVAIDLRGFRSGALNVLAGVVAAGEPPCDAHVAATVVERHHRFDAGLGDSLRAGAIPPSAADAASDADLGFELQGIGAGRDVEWREGLALLVLDDVEWLRSDKVREAVIATAGRHGARAIAVELRERAAVAPAAEAAGGGAAVHRA